MGGNSECKTYIHSATVSFNRGINEFINSSEDHDLVEFLPDLGPRHPKDSPVQKYVLATSQLRMKPRTHFKQACDASPDFHSALGRLRDAAQNLEECAFASAVASNDAENLASLNLEASVLESPEFF